MLPDKRRQEILRLNYEKQGISIKELAHYFKVSNMTVLRDVKILKAQKKLDLVRGGVVPLESIDDSSLFSVENYDFKKRESLSEKQQIAEYCAENFIKEGNIIALEGGSTAGAMIRFLAKKKKITLITNGFFVLQEAYATLNKSSRVICTGGILETPYLLFLGPDVEHFFKTRHTDIAFISCVAFDFTVGPMDSYPLDIQSKQSMLRSAQRRVLMIDKNKFNLRSVMQTIDIKEITDLVTNSSISSDILEQLQKLNVKLHLA
ncbi:DeoR/GlpR family DNA-binding transcription regulator [Candidatus Hepatincolaceae symbiont of Richtersius coronifer]